VAWKRPPRWPARPLAPQERLGGRPPVLRRALRRAHRMMADGDFHGAASAFASLARAARAAGAPVRAAVLDLQSARALLAVGRPEVAERRAKSGLLTLIAAGRGRRAAELVPRVVEQFRSRGHEPHADRLATEVGHALSEARVSAPEPAAHDQAGARALPTRCSGCGAPLFAEDVEWRDATTASCTYCGSAIRTN
jgi:hypothetical protein